MWPKKTLHSLKIVHIHSEPWLKKLGQGWPELVLRAEWKTITLLPLATLPSHGAINNTAELEFKCTSRVSFPEHQSHIFGVTHKPKHRLQQRTCFGNS